MCVFYLFVAYDNVQFITLLHLQGKLKPMEHIIKGFDNMPKAFLELFWGSNIGKAIVRVSQTMAELLDAMRGQKC